MRMWEIKELSSEAAKTTSTTTAERDSYVEGYGCGYEDGYTAAMKVARARAERGEQI